MLKRRVLSRVLKVSNDWAVLMAVGRVFQVLGPAELKDESWL